MALFGWCLPDMDIPQHSKCTASFESTICHCMCHVDMTLFTKEYNAKNNKKTTETTVKKRTPNSKKSGVSNTKAPSAGTRVRGTTTATTSGEASNTRRTNRVTEESWESTSSILTDIVQSANLKSQQLINEQQLN
jgi:hypothetical protein